MCGRQIPGTIATVVLPLARPGVDAAMTLLFILSTRELGSSLFLYSSGSMVMAVQLLGYYEGGNHQHHGRLQPGAGRAPRGAYRDRQPGVARPTPERPVPFKRNEQVRRNEMLT